MANEKNIEPHKWKKGQSGNPGGRPTTRPFKEALNAEIRDRGTDAQSLRMIARTLLEKAEGGDIQAASFVAERLEGRPAATISLDLPVPLADMSPADALAAISNSVATGEITPQEGQQLTAIIDARIKAVELVDLEKRLTELEQRK